MRTDREIVDQTNELAGYMLSVMSTGYVTPPGFKFYEATDPRAQSAWHRACDIQQMMTQTDANNALANLEPEIVSYKVSWTIDVEATSPREAAEKARAYQTKPRTTATVFTVASASGEPQVIDLHELELEDEAQAEMEEQGWRLASDDERLAGFDKFQHEGGAQFDADTWFDLMEASPSTDID